MGLHEGQERSLQIKGLQIHGSEEPYHFNGLVTGFVVTPRDGDGDMSSDFPAGGV